MAKADNIYAACDNAIMEMNRENLKAFGKLKLMKTDELNVIREVRAVYTQSAKRARKRYFEVAYEAYLLALAMMGIGGKKAYEMAEKSITAEWTDAVMSRTDPLTLYRFDSETERKADRLIEALSETQNRNYEVDKALRLWSRQLGQYAINYTDYAVLKAYEDAGVTKVRWQTAGDEKVCPECRTLNGQVFPIAEVPPKPHWGCRCRWVPAD